METTTILTRRETRRKQHHGTGRGVEEHHERMLLQKIEVRGGSCVIPRSEGNDCRERAKKEVRVSPFKAKLRWSRHKITRP
jgi:hypothetical protein